MKLIRYHSQPVYSASRQPVLHDEMDRLFDALFSPGSPVRRGAGFPVDLYQDKNAYTVRAELPGFPKEAIGINLADGLLTITGSEKSEGKDEILVSRSVTLPENVDVEKIQAAYENGVLTVTLPKREEVKPRQIDIDVK